MEFIQVGPTLQFGVDRFDGSRMWRTISVVLTSDDDSLITASAYVTIPEDEGGTDYVLMIFYRFAPKWSWLTGQDCIALADGVRLRPPGDPELETEVLDDGDVSEMVLVRWTLPQLRLLGRSTMPEIRIGVVELDLRPMVPGLLSLVDALDAL